MTTPTVGEIIRTERQRRGWTIAQLSDHSGVHRVMIARVETGARALKVDTLLRICSGLEVSLEIFDAAKPMRITT